MWGLELAPRWLTHLRPTARRFAIGATTLITPIPAPRMAITVLAGLMAACSWALGLGTAGAGDMAGAVAGSMAVAATATDAADTDAEPMQDEEPTVAHAEPMRVEEPMRAEHADTQVEQLAAMPAEHAVATQVAHAAALAAVAHAVDSAAVAMQAVAAATAAADTDKL